MSDNSSERIESFRLIGSHIFNKMVKNQ